MKLLYILVMTCPLGSTPMFCFLYSHPGMIVMTKVGRRLLIHQIKKKIMCLPNPRMVEDVHDKT